MISLRPYQEDLIARTRASLQSGKRAPLLVSPCGSGKTVLFCYFAQQVSERGKRTLILAHRDELLDQISDTLKQFNVPHGFVAAGRPASPYQKVQVASVFSMARRLKQIRPPDIIIIDEAHHAIAGSTWGKVLEAWPDAFRIGVTATPQRLGGEGLDDIFDDLIVGPSVAELIQLGALAPFRLFAPPSKMKMEGVHIRAGDFAKNELAKVADTATVTGDAVAHYTRLAAGKRAIVFCVSIEHAKHVAEQFRNAGYSAASLDGGMARDIRRMAVQEFRDGKLQILTSCDIISEGFDLPAIEVAVMLRPTASLALWVQQSGRSLRPYPGKDAALILDHAANALRHGLPDDPREWTLAGRDKTKKQRQPSSRIRICEKCSTAARLSARVCPYCGAPFDISGREVEEVEGELVEVERKALEARQAKAEVGMAFDREALEKIAKERGYRFGWVDQLLRARARKRGIPA